MTSVFYYNRRLSFFLCFSLIIVSLPLFSTIRVLPDSTSELITTQATKHDFYRFLNAGKGSQAEGLSELKHYFAKFGYLPHPPKNTAFTNLFDEKLEKAVFSYQKNLGLPQTGKLDSQTMKVVVSPRCGVSYHTHARKTSKHFASYGKPQWALARPSPVSFTYAFAPKHMVDYLSFPKVHGIFQRSFARWSRVVPVTFTEVKNYSHADVKIGWYEGDHGDGAPFDGSLGILAHALPGKGFIHLDASERWAVNLKKEKSKKAIHLESVAMHEIGHVLGMNHSNVEDAIMYPYIGLRTKKVELHRDDVERIQSLYGLVNTDDSNSNDLNKNKLQMDWTFLGASIAVVLVLFIFIYSQNCYHCCTCCCTSRADDVGPS